MALNTTQEQNLLRPGLNAVFGDYDQYPSEWSHIYETYQSKMNFEIDIEMKLTGLAAIRPQGAPTQEDNMGQRTRITYFHKYVALQFSITREALLDNLYKAQFPIMAKALKKSLAQSKETLGAAILNNGFDAAYPLGDGQPLYSTSHPIDNGLVANTPTVGVDLNEASLEAGLIGVQLFKDQAGLVVATQGEMLLVPPQLQFTADRLLGSQFRPAVANNDINSIVHQGMLPKGFKVNHYLTNPSAWFLITSAPEGFKHFVREPVSTDTYSDFSTDNILCKAVERYSFGVSNFRCTWGSPGA